MNDNIAIKVEHVSKDFKLPHEKQNSLKSFFTSLTKNKTNGYEVQHALRDISFEIKKGEFFGIVGRNGSGKSTLLKIIAEIYQPTKGSIKVNGKLVPFIELGVGFNPELTGRENIYLSGALNGFSSADIDEMYDDIVRFAELEPFIDQKLKNYSSGMQVRLAFAVATRADADILLVDEVLAVGDAEFQRKCFKYFKSLKKNKKTVVFVSHDMDAVREYCDRAVLIEASHIIKEGAVNDIAGAYTKLFIEEAAASLDNSSGDSRWGDNQAVYTRVSINPKKLTDNDLYFEVAAQYEVKKTIENPVFGFTIKDAAGMGMFGSNTKLKGIKTEVMSSGLIGKVVWQVPNILNDGEYTLDVALVSSNLKEVHDWWEGAHTFRSYRDNHTGYLVEPAVEVTLK